MAPGIIPPSPLIFISFKHCMWGARFECVWLLFSFSYIPRSHIKDRPLHIVCTNSINHNRYFMLFLSVFHIYSQFWIFVHKCSIDEHSEMRRIATTNVFDRTCTCSLPLWRVHEFKRMYLVPRTHCLFIT